jgi:hypothetical protein
MPPEVDADAVFWLRLDAELAGDRNESGYAGRIATDYVLTEWNINAPENRETARTLLRYLAWGRIDGRNEDIKPEKPLKNA